MYSSGLLGAADTLSASPASIQLRYLQTLLEVGADHNSTIIFPLPIDLVSPLMGLLEKKDPPSSTP